MKLSIIIPYYRAWEYTKRLIERLKPQLNDEIEIIVIDDGCREERLDELGIKVIHLKENSGGASVPRNVGLDEAKGEYVTFIDADDMVSEDYIEEIFKKIKEGFDYCYFGWNFKGEDILIEEEPLWWNGSVCNCVYRRSIIGKERFRPEIRIGEDKEFNERVRKGKRMNINKVLYHYNLDNPNSITYNERGFKTIEHKNIFYVNDLNIIGGVETYLYEILKKYHTLDIAVVYKTAHQEQLKRIKKFCKAYKHTDEILVCDVCVINYDISIIPYICDTATVYQGIHADYDNQYYIKNGFIPPTHPRIDYYIAITKHIADTFSSVSGIPKDKIVQHYNPLSVKEDKPLVLVSMTRLTPEKGEKRMQLLVERLDNAGVNYIWFIFTDSDRSIESKNVVYMPPTLDNGRWMDIADYLVQLSDSEGLSYSINEMLYRNKPVIVTPLHYLDELGIKDGVNAYILDLDCGNIDSVVKKIKKVPKFKFKQLDDGYNKILAKSKSHYKEEKLIMVTLKCEYFLGVDAIKEGKHVNYGETIEVDEERAKELLATNCFSLQE